MSSASSLSTMTDIREESGSALRTSSETQETWQESLNSAGLTEGTMRLWTEPDEGQTAHALGRGKNDEHPVDDKKQPTMDGSVPSLSTLDEVSDADGSGTAFPGQKLTSDSSSLSASRYMASTEMISAQVHRWLMSLSLTRTVRVAKHDLRSGYLVADILKAYFPHHRSNLMLVDGFSLDILLGNWKIITKFLSRTSIVLDEQLISGVIHMKPGAAVRLLHILFQELTGERLSDNLLKYPPPPGWVDVEYQSKLPHHARSTAAKALKTNLCVTEIIGSQGDGELQSKARQILWEHQMLKHQEKITSPGRFQTKPQLEKFPTRPEKVIRPTKPAATRDHADNVPALLNVIEAESTAPSVPPMSADAEVGYCPPTITFKVTDLYPERGLQTGLTNATAVTATTTGGDGVKQAARDYSVEETVMFAAMPRPKPLPAHPPAAQQSLPAAAAAAAAGVGDIKSPETDPTTESSPAGSEAAHKTAPIHTLHDMNYGTALYLEEIVQQDSSKKSEDHPREVKVYRYDSADPPEHILQTLHPDCGEIIGHQEVSRRDRQFAGYEPRVHYFPLETILLHPDVSDEAGTDQAKVQSTVDTQFSKVPGDQGPRAGVIPPLQIGGIIPGVSDSDDESDSDSDPDPNVVRLLASIDLPSDEEDQITVHGDVMYDSDGNETNKEEDEQDESSQDLEAMIAKAEQLQMQRQQSRVSSMAHLGKKDGAMDLLGTLSQGKSREVCLAPDDYMLYRMHRHNIIYGLQREKVPSPSVITATPSATSQEPLRQTSAADPPAIAVTQGPLQRSQSLLAAQGKDTTSNTTLRRQDSDLDTNKAAIVDQGRKSPSLQPQDQVLVRRPSMTSPSSQLQAQKAREVTGPIITVDSEETQETAKTGAEETGGDVKSPPQASLGTTLQVSPPGKTDKSPSDASSPRSAVPGDASLLEPPGYEDQNLEYEPTNPDQGFYLVEDRANIQEDPAQRNLKAVTNTKFFRGNPRVDPAQMGIPPDGQNIPCRSVAGVRDVPSDLLKELQTDREKAIQRRDQQLPGKPVNDRDVIGVIRRRHQLERILRVQEHFLRVFEAETGRLNRKLPVGSGQCHEIGELTRFTDAENEVMREMRHAFIADSEKSKNRFLPDTSAKSFFPTTHEELLKHRGESMKRYHEEDAPSAEDEDEDETLMELTRQEESEHLVSMFYDSPTNGEDPYDSEDNMYSYQDHATSETDDMHYAANIYRRHLAEFATAPVDTILPGLEEEQRMAEELANRELDIQDLQEQEYQERLALESRSQRMFGKAAWEEVKAGVGLGDDRAEGVTLDELDPWYSMDDVMAVTPEDFPTSDYFAPRMASGDEEADGSSGYSKLSFDTAVSLDPSPPELG